MLYHSLVGALLFVDRGGGRGQLHEYIICAHKDTCIHHKE